MRKNFPAVSIVLFVLAAIALVVGVYLFIAAASAPVSFRGVADLLVNAFGPVFNLVIQPLLRAASSLMVIIGLINLALGGILAGLGFGLRNHRDLSARVTALEARLEEMGKSTG